MKATHIGTCQACGRSQKLPGNLLSKHGYTVDWGFFIGTCPGSNHQPFEVSCDLIKGFIANAEMQKVEVVRYQAELRQPATVNKAWVHDYGTPNGERKDRYVWRQVELNTTTHEIDGRKWESYSYKSLSPFAGRVDFYTYPGPQNVLEACTLLSSKRADAMQKDVVDQLNRYIDWQTNRVTTWKPGTLTPVKES